MQNTKLSKMISTIKTCQFLTRNIASRTTIGPQFGPRILPRSLIAPSVKVFTPIRPFSRTLKSHYFDPRRDPRRVIFPRFTSRSSPFGFTPFTPGFTPLRFPLLRIIFGIFLFTSFFIFIAAPLLIVVLPLTLILGFGWFKLRQNANRLFLNRQLASLANSKLKYRSRIRDINLIEDPEFPKFVTQRLRIFIEDGEQGNDLIDEIRDINTVWLNPDGYSKIYQNWVVDDGQEQLLVVLNTELMNLGVTLLDVRITLKEVSDGVYEVVIELQNGFKKYLISDDSQWGNFSDNDRIIDIKDYDVRKF